MAGKSKTLLFALYKVIENSLGFWIPHGEFRISGTEFPIPIVSGIPDSEAQDSRFHSQNFSDSGIRFTLHEAIYTALRQHTV